jgi:hypothetical protein
VEVSKLISIRIAIKGLAGRRELTPNIENNWLNGLTLSGFIITKDKSLKISRSSTHSC